MLGLLLGGLVSYGVAIHGRALPGLSLASPASGNVTGVVPLWARADAAGFSSLQFFVSGQQIGPTITSGACATSWDTRSVPNASYTVTAVARDGGGTAVSTAPVVVRVANGVAPDTAPPSVTLTGPTSAAAVVGAIVLRATVADASGVAGVWFTLDGQTVGTETVPTQGQASLTWASTASPNGAHVLRAVARDGAGNVAASSPITITVRNPAVGGDFDGDGDPDLLFQHTDGRLYLWMLEDGVAAFQRGLTPASVDPAWRVVGLDDFNGDGSSDVLLQHTTTGQVTLWYMNGSVRSGEVAVQPGSTPWRVSTTGDIDGDGDPDIVWRLPATGQLYVWTTQGGAVTGGGALAPSTIDVAWRIAGAFDVNRDGKSDLVWQNSSTGALYVWYMNGLTMTSGGGFTPASAALVWRLDAVGDFNRDGHADLVWHHQTTGQLYTWSLTGTTSTAQRFLSPAQVDPAWRIVGTR